MKKNSLILAGAFLAALALTWNPQAAETVLFSDSFDAVSSSNNWTVINGSSDGVPDFTVDWAYNYGTSQYTSNGVAFTIPPAPNGSGSVGVKLTVNKDDVPATSAVNLFASGQNFSGNFALRFDMWINYNGGAYGGTGSTEFGIFGIDHSGTIGAWPTEVQALSQSDGIWFAVTGEAGANRDFRNYEGDPAGSPLPFTGVDGGFIDRDNNGSPEEEPFSAAGEDYPLHVIFPTPPYETQGVPGKHWVEVEVRQRDGTVTWLINGYVIAEKFSSLGWTSGTVMIGTMDIFSSLANPRQDNYVIFDNVRVVSLDAPKPRLTLTVTAPDAAEPNTTGSFTISRTGDTSAALPVLLNIRGTATPGSDYNTIPLSTNIPAGVADLVINVTPINDQSGEQTETIKVNLVSNEDEYEVFAPMMGTINLADDGDVTLAGVSMVDDVAYEGIPGEDMVFSVYRIGDTNTDLNVNITFGGTASSTSDYNPPASPVLIPAGATNVLVTIGGTADQLDEEDETVVLTVAAGDGYSVAPASASATGRIHEIGPLLFSDDFESDHSADYNLLFSAANGIPDYRAGFSYDYSLAETPIPPSPHGTGTTLGLLLTVNKDEASASGAASVNVYPKGKSFSGDYLLKFDMFMQYGPVATTEAAIFGMNHSGNFTNRYNTAGSDGLWFMVETDGSAQGGRSYVLFAPTNTAAVPPFEAKPASEFTSVFPSPPFQAAGAPSGDWVDVSVQQENNVITWKINNNLIFQKTNSGPMTAGDIMLGHMDTFNSIGSTNTFTIFDNVRVYQLNDTTNAPVEINITGITKGANNTMVIEFTTTGGTSNLVVEGSETANGTYGVEQNAQITPGTQGQITATVATVPITTTNRFFRIRQGP